MKILRLGISGSKEVKRTKNSQIDIDRSIHFGHLRHIMLLLFSLVCIYL